MCGICGFVYSDQGASQHEPYLRQMNAQIHHRGPDDEGYYVDECAALGMRRLSIIDLVTGDQPMTNEDRTIWLVFNGEIYNYKEIPPAWSSAVINSSPRATPR